MSIIVQQFLTNEKVNNKMIILFHPFSNHFLGLSFAIGVGGVNEVSSELHKSIQDLETCLPC